MKTNAERQREYQRRRKARLAEGLPPTLTAEEKVERVRVATKTPKVPVDLPKEITREWVLERLRYFTLNPGVATPAAVKAAEALLKEIPKGGHGLSDPIAPVIVRNTLRVNKRGPSEAAAALMALEAAERAERMGPDIPAPRIIGEEEESNHENEDG